MTRRTWFLRIAALLPFAAARFQQPVALGTLRVGERFRFVRHSSGVWQRSLDLGDGWISAKAGKMLAPAYRDWLVYRVR